MRDYLRRFLIVGIVALCISLLFLGGKHSQAKELSIKERTEDWIWPTEGVISDIFGTREGRHKGIDIAGELGTGVLAVASGTVSKSYYSTSYGHVVFIKHDNDGFETVYAHLNKRLVSEGQKLKQGEKIGEMGNTGQSSGVHLHFEIHEKEWTYEKKHAVNPTLVLGDIELGEKISDKKQLLAFEDMEESRVFPAMAMEKRNQYEKIRHILGARQAELFIHTKQQSDELPQTEHEISVGETLWSIANQYNVSVASIMKDNELTSDVIHPGQTLQIPRKDKENQKEQQDIARNL